MAKPSITTAAAAAKPAKEPKEKKEATGARAEHMAKKITVLFKETPGREGTKARAAREAYKTGMTVREYIDAGGDPGYIRPDVAAGLIRLS